MDHPQGSTEVPQIFPVSIFFTALCCLQSAESDISWRHPTKLSQLTIKLLAQRHGMTIKDLHISKLSLENDTQDLPFYGLEKLHVADMDPHCSSQIVPKIMISSHSSLKHLKLGCERFIANPCLLGGNPLAEQELYDFTDDMLGHFEGALRCTGRSRSSMLLQLETLHLIGLDFRKLTADSEAPFLELSELSRLKVLTLESCFIEGATLSLLSPQTALGLTWTPRLQSFSLRYEKSDAAFQHQVRAFLRSFTGLVHLSVLLEGSGGSIDPDCFIKNHGRTLKTLVWDQRSKPRTLVGQPTSIPLDSSVRCCAGAIARGCPGLRELGLSLRYASGLPYEHWVSRYSYHPSLDDQDTYMCSGIWCSGIWCTSRAE